MYTLSQPNASSEPRVGDNSGKIVVPAAEENWADLGGVSTADINHDHSNGAATDEVKRLRAQVAELVEQKQALSSDVLKLTAPRAPAGKEGAKDLGNAAAELTVQVSALSRQLKEAEAASAQIVKGAMEQQERTAGELAKAKRELEKHKAGGGGGGDGGGGGGSKAAPTDFHAGISHWVNNEATPGEISLFYRVKQSLSRVGLAATQTSLDAVQPKPGVHQIMECAREGGRSGSCDIA